VEEKPKYEILDSLPAYGPMYIPISLNGKPFYHEGFVVKFFKNDGSYWVGNFDTGWSNLNQVIELQGNLLFVLAGGIGYLINPNDSNKIDILNGVYTHLLKTDNSKIIIFDYNYLTVIESDGNYWDSERISIDGFDDVVIDKNIIRGYALYPFDNEDKRIPFEYNIDTKVLVGGSYNYDEQSPWWKVW